MSTLSFAGYVTDPGDVGHSRITDLAIVEVDGAAHLYSTTRYDGVLRQWTIADGSLAIGSDQSFSGDVIAGGVGGITLVTLEGAPGLLVGGGAGGDLQTIALDPMGGFGTATPLMPLSAAFEGFQHGTAVTLADGGQAVFGALAGQSGLAQLRFDENGLLADQAVLQGIQPETTTRIAATAAITIDGQSFLVTASGQHNGVTTHAIDAAGNIIAAQSVSADDGLWISAPTALELATIGDSTYAVLASAGTDSLSVIEIAPDGSMIVRDHILDSRDTRFGGVTSLEIIEADGKTYVIAGGADDGISVFVLLEGGLLVHRASIEDTVDFSLDNISALAGRQRAGGIDIFAASSSEPGVTQLRLETGPAGITQTATSQGGVLNGTIGGDVLQGHDGDDIIIASAGNDILRDGLGSDFLSGGTGADLFIMSADGETDTITDFTVGEDKIDLSLWPLLRDISQLFITIQDNGMRITYGQEVLNVQSADGNPIDYRFLSTDDLIGASRLPVGITPGFPGPQTPTPPLGEPPTEPPADQGGPNSMLTPIQMIKAGNLDQLRGAMNDPDGGILAGVLIDGQDSAEILIGSDGFDLIFAGGGDDIVQGLGGDDTILGRAGDDTLVGGDGADTLLGGSGADTLTGGNGQDMLDGGAGADQLDGGAGDDVLFGRGGADTFIFNSGTDVIGDFEQGLDQITLDPSLWTGLTSAADVLRVYGSFEGDRATIDFGDGNILQIEGITDPATLADDITLF